MNKRLLTEQLNNNSWKQFLEYRNKFKQFGANPKVADSCEIKDQTRRRIKLRFENSEYPSIVDEFTINSGREVSLPKTIQDIVEEYKKNYPKSHLMFEVIDVLTDQEQIGTATVFG